jgi:hypothetical protein
MTNLRAWANARIIQFRIWYEQRQAYRDRTLVVSNHWDGSVQVFYHFLLGYFAPLTVWLRKSGSTRIAVRDCGPMNQWFDLLPPEVDVQIIKPGVALHSIAGNRSRSSIVRGLDYPTRHNRKRLRAAISAMRSFLPPIEIEGPQILVVDRASSDDFHSGPLSETEMSGARRRSVPNLAALSSQFLDPSLVRVVDMAACTPHEQVALASNARILIAQHGAGLAHMIWMTPGSVILEIHPPLPGEAIDVFRYLAAALGHTYIRIPQDGVHAPVDENAFLEALTAANVVKG